MAVSVVVLSGKGGTSKTMWQMMLAGEGSRAGYSTLLIDADPERNLSNRYGAVQNDGLGNVFEEAGVSTGESSAEKGAARFAELIVSTDWPNVDLMPAGSSLTGISQIAIADTWLLRDILTVAGIYDRYDLIFIDTGGRTGSLVTVAMYAGDVAYAPIGPTLDAVRKATEAKGRVERIQRAHNLRWAGVVASNFDSRTAMDTAILDTVRETFGNEVRAEVPRRSIVNEAFQLTERLGDKKDTKARVEAETFRTFLEHDLMQRDAALATAGAH